MLIGSGQEKLFSLLRTTTLQTSNKLKRKQTNPKEQSLLKKLITISSNPLVFPCFLDFRKRESFKLTIATPTQKRNCSLSALYRTTVIFSLYIDEDHSGIIITSAREIETTSGQNYTGLHKGACCQLRADQARQAVS